MLGKIEEDMSKLTHLWVSCSKATGYVRCNEEGIILETIPLWKTFLGQPVKNLISWLTKIAKGVKIKEMEGF